MTGQIISIAAASGVLVLLLGWRIWRMFCPRGSWLDHPAVFFVLVFAAMLVLRLPQITWAREINVDESQMLAQGMRYVSHPVPWRDVDGTTSGPLNSWFLSAPILLGAPATWTTARTMLWTANCATLLFIYLALRCFGTRPEAQLALMPTVFFYAFALDYNSTHYSSETLPVLLLAIMVWLLCRAWVTGKFSNASLFLNGLLAGCIPFAKLQASPLAAFLWAAGLGLIIFPHRQNCRRKLGLMCLGTVLFPALLLGVVWICGAGNDFWKSYILAPAAYTHEGLGTKMRALWFLFTFPKDFRSYFVSALAVGILLTAAWSYAKEAKLGRKLLVPLSAIFGLGVTAVFCVAVAGKGFGHYLLLLIPAQSVFFGLAFSAGKTLLAAPEAAEPHLFPKPIHWFLAGFALVISLQIGKAPVYFNTVRSFLAHQKPERKSFVARRILQAVRPGDSMSVWGWMPAYYVETGLMPATRDAIGHFIIEPGPYRHYYDRRYLNDFKQSRPAIFVDAMADGVFVPPWATLTPHEFFPDLNRFIEDNYTLWLTVHFMTAKGAGLPVRIYLLKPRMKELHLMPEELTIPMDPSLAPE